MPGFRIKRRVWLAGTGALLVIAAWWRWSSLTPPPVGRAPSPGQPQIQLAAADAAAADKALLERAKLFDPTPLFFPTEWNYGQQSSREAVLREPGQVFGGFEPKLTVGEQSVPAYRGDAVGGPDKLSDIVAQGSEAAFAGIGQVGQQRPTLPVRAAYLEVWDLKSGELIISQQLSGISPPRPDFAPIELLVAVGSAGVVGEPILTSGSGGDDMDVFFRDYLVDSYRLGQRLRPGRYRVLVGT